MAAFTNASWAQQWAQPAAYGIYINANAAGGTRGDALVDQLVAAGGNAVVFDVKDRLGRLSYPSEVKLARAIGASKEATIDHPAEVVRSWRDRGLYVIARLTCFHDALLAQRRARAVADTPGTGSGTDALRDSIFDQIHLQNEKGTAWARPHRDIPEGRLRLGRLSQYLPDFPTP